MKCPNCDVDLLLGDKSNIEIDYCPKCRGIWLDRGELEKIIERANDYYQRANPERARESAFENNQHHYNERKHHDDDDHKYGYNEHDYKNRGYKKKGFLGDLFDF